MAGYNEGREEKRKGKRKEKNKKMRWSTASFLFFSRAPLVMWVMETCVISGSCSLLEQHASPVNPNEAPHPVHADAGVGEVK
jgi:hypothetical protein